MTTIKKLLVGAIAVLVTTTVIRTVGASASTLDSGRHFNVESNFNGVSQATGWNSPNLNKSISQTGTVSAQTAKTTTASTSQVSATQGDGWNAISANEIYLMRNGVKLTDWQKCGTAWYYFGTDGKMQFDKWLQSGSGWYYVLADGTMAIDCYISGYYVNISGLYDASKNDSSKGTGVFGKNGNESAFLLVCNDSSLTGSKSYTNTQFEALRQQCKLGVKTVTQTSNGISSKSFEWYLK